MALLKLDGVRAGYGDTVVLEDIDLALNERESLSIIGRNGVGKSTLLATLMGHAALHSGTITLIGRVISGFKPYRRVAAGLGYVPQEREIFPSLTVAENLAVAVRPGPWDRSRVFELFPQLFERRNNPGNSLSGGEQQMLAIARALVGNPRLLLMDEPSEGLAPVIVQQLQQVLRQLRETDSLSIILVEQNSHVALQFAERCLVMRRGRIIFDGESGELRDDAKRLDRLIGVDSAG